jgi:hypothetical protein
MNKQQDMTNKVNEALESLDGIQRAEPAPWFFTRVKARLERDERNVWETAGRFLARPAVTIAGLFFILTLNVFILVKRDATATTGAFATTTSQAPEDENILVAANSFDYENLEP